MSTPDKPTYILRICVVSAIALAIAFFPRVHDTGFLHLDEWWLLLPISLVAGIIFLAIQINELRKGEFDSSDKKILLGYCSLTAVYFLLMYFSADTELSFRKAVVMDYGYEADENYEHLVTVYFFEDIAHVICSIGFFLIHWNHTLKLPTVEFRKSILRFVFFLSVILCVHFYYTDQNRSSQQVEQEFPNF
jgi:hypothetical protein